MHEPERSSKNRSSLINSDNNLHPSFTRTYFVSNIKIRQKHEGA
jgi:hypothetical protein